METLDSSRITPVLDDMNLQFTVEKKRRLARLSELSEAELEWLMVEHYQLSVRNPDFLSTAATTTKAFAEPAVTEELQRNLKEENGRAATYKRALAEVGIDVDRHVEFAPTTEFFAKVLALITDSPQCALGTIYATETAARFEHEVFLDISREIAGRRSRSWEQLRRFHEAHLAGVEPRHEGGLAELIDRVARGGTGDIVFGAAAVIDAMDAWWNNLLAHVAKR